MKNMMRKAVCMIACAAMAVTGIVAGVPVAPVEVVQAAEKEPIQVGDNVYATLDDYGTLTIAGEGDMWENNHNGVYNMSRAITTHGDTVTYSDDWCDFEKEFCPWFGEYEDEINAVVFDEGITKVGSHAFTVCLYANRNTHYYSHRGHRGLSSITSVTLSSTVNTIGEGAFYATPALRSITIPSNVTTIERCAFLNSALSSVTLNEGLTSIGEYAFARTKLVGINIPSTVKSIEPNTFLDSTLSNVTINQGTKIIKKDAFQNVTAKIYDREVVIMEGAFGSGSTFICYKGSTADEYAKNHGINIKYITEKPEKAKKPTVKQKNKKLYITCKTTTKVDGYKIRISANKSMKNSSTAFGNKFIAKGLKKGKKYYIQVCAYNEYENGKKVYGAWSDTVSVTFK